MSRDLLLKYNVKIGNKHQIPMLFNVTNLSV